MPDFVIVNLYSSYSLLPRLRPAQQIYGFPFILSFLFAIGLFISTAQSIAGRVHYSLYWAKSIILALKADSTFLRLHGHIILQFSTPYLVFWTITIRIRKLNSLLSLCQDTPILFLAAFVSTKNFSVANIYKSIKWWTTVLTCRNSKWNRETIIQGHDTYVRIFGIDWVSSTNGV